MAWHQSGDKQWTSAGILLTGPRGNKLQWNFNLNYFINWTKSILKCHQGNSHFFSTSMCYNYDKPLLELIHASPGHSELTHWRHICETYMLKYKNFWDLISNLTLMNCFFNVTLFSIIVPHTCNISVRNWSSTMNILSVFLWVLMAWCFSTRASVATLLNIQPYVWLVFDCYQIVLIINDTAENSIYCLILV